MLRYFRRRYRPIGANTTGTEISVVKHLKNIAKYTIGEQVRHRIYGFRGVVFDVDPEFANTDEWYQSIPAESRPRKDQPFYHLFAESTEQSPYVAYVSEQNLVPDEDDDPISHPEMVDYFDGQEDGRYVPRMLLN
jgi:heat shock protein HspQ